MLKLNKLPGIKGSFTANTEKRTKMYRYQVSGKEEFKQLYMQAKEQEGYPAIVDSDYGLLYFTAKNLGKEATLETYVDNEGKLRISSYNEDLREIEDLKATGVSADFIDRKIVEALSKGKYATIVTVDTTVTNQDVNLDV